MEQTTLAIGELEPKQERALVKRRFCIEALAYTVPKYRNREQAANTLAGFYPSDQFALASLHRRISENIRHAA